MWWQRIIEVIVGQVYGPIASMVVTAARWLAGKFRNRGAAGTLFGTIVLFAGINTTIAPETHEGSALALVICLFFLGGAKGGQVANAKRKARRAGRADR